MKLEVKLQREIMLDCGRLNWLCFHINVGKILMPNGLYFSTGLPNGWPDLLIITDYGATIYVETKIKPNKLSPNQIKMFKILTEKQVIVKIIFSISEWHAFKTTLLVQ